MDEQNRNLILATALSFIVILVWFLVFPPVEPDTVTTEQQAGQDSTVSDTGVPVTDAAPVPSIQMPGADLTGSLVDVTEPSDADIRVPIATPRISGTIRLNGGRIDDLLLNDYKETLDEGSPDVRLLSPAGQRNAYYALFGWTPADDLGFDAVPNATTSWKLEDGEVLSPDRPITLVWDNQNGLIFRREISIDANYLFSIRQSVSNYGSVPVRLAPYGIIARHGEPDTIGFFILHEGVVRMSDSELEEIDYNDMPDMPPDSRENANVNRISVASNGWIGFTDKYWMTTLIPQPGQSFESVAKYTQRGDGIYQTEMRLPTEYVAPRSVVNVESMLFAGAKEWNTIREYESGFGIDRFIDSIDWGWFFFLTKPMFFVLYWLNGYINNLGWSIIGLTFIIKAILFPLAYKSYVSMARMKELQPEMEKIKERVGGDRQKLQAEMMAMYKKNKVNPASGCLPIIPQIPIFFSLYKVIFVTIELRHAPFILWIKDLSAPDPTSILNLFGLLPWGTPEQGTLLAIISLGVLPILLGVTMWMQQKLNPAPTDPTQAMIFAWMPWIFMFMLGQFASGLIIYWVANNTITFMQQYLIMRSQGVKPDVLGNIYGSFQSIKLFDRWKRPQPPPEETKSQRDSPDTPPKRRRRKRKARKRKKN